MILQLFKNPQLISIECIIVCWP